jgi:hypothetical protein
MPNEKSAPQNLDMEIAGAAVTALIHAETLVTLRLPRQIRGRPFWRRSDRPAAVSRRKDLFVEGETGGDPAADAAMSANSVVQAHWAPEASL